MSYLLFSIKSGSFQEAGDHEHLIADDSKDGEEDGGLVVC